MNFLFFIFLFINLGKEGKKSQLLSTFHVLRATAIEENTEELGSGVGDRHTERSFAVLFTEHSSRGASSAGWELSG